MFKTARSFIASFVLLVLAGQALVIASPLRTTASHSNYESFTVLSLKHESVGSLTRILIESNVPPLYTVTRQSNTLILIDLPAEASRLAPSYAIQSEAVHAINVRSGAGKAVSGSARTSIEIGVREGVTDSSRIKGNTLIVELVSSQINSAVQQAAKAQTTVKPGVYVDLAPASAPAESKEKAEKASPKRESVAPETVRAQPVDANNGDGKRATLVRGVRSETLADAARIIVDTDGAAAFTNFSLANPHRIVVDIAGVRNLAGNQTLAVGAFAVEKVRVGQPTANTVRIVVDTKAQTAYRVDREGAAVVITVGNTTTTANATTKSAAPVPPAPVTSQPALETKSEQA